MAEHDANLGWFLEQTARELASRHHLSDQAALPIPAWAALGAGFEWLHDVRRACTNAPPEASKAAEWLLDNVRTAEQYSTTLAAG